MEEDKNTNLSTDEVKETNFSSDEVKEERKTEKNALEREYRLVETLYDLKRDMVEYCNNQFFSLMNDTKTDEIFDEFVYEQILNESNL